MAEHAESPFSALKSKWANLGSLGIFLYVGAEVCVISGMIFFLEQKQILNVPSQVAGFVGPVFMLFAMFGRFGGSVLLRYFKATSMLAMVATFASILCLIVIATYPMPATPLGGRRPAQRQRRLQCAADHGLYSGLRRHPDRPVQLDHVPDHLHHHARTLDGPGLGDLRPDVHGHLRRRVHLDPVRLHG